MEMRSEGTLHRLGAKRPCNDLRRSFRTRKWAARNTQGDAPIGALPCAGMRGPVGAEWTLPWLECVALLGRNGPCPGMSAWLCWGKINFTPGLYAMPC